MQLLSSFLFAAPILVEAFRLPFSQNPTSHYYFGVDDVKVPVQLGVMSRCPDALFCENVFDQVLSKVSSRVDISLVYVAKFDSEDKEFGVKCLHGPEECAGNVQQLCVAKHEPDVWWKFVQCQNFEGRYKVGNPDLALRCAKTVGIDWQGAAGKCAGLDGSGRGAEGIALLKESTALGHKLGIEKSCTVLINGKQVCIHDETWKNCENGHTVKDFVDQINAEYDELNAA